MSSRALLLSVLCATGAPGVVSTATAQSRASNAGQWEVPRTPDGHPDLQGNWTNQTMTPIQRREGQGPVYTPEEVAEVRDDVIMATGRSDYPNQVNNVLGFPFLFRGALDVCARAINPEMMVAATRALAELAKASVPQSVAAAYGGEVFEFGPEYLIPKPFDSRVLFCVAPAVAKAAMDSGVARQPIDLIEYEKRLDQMVIEIASL